MALEPNKACPACRENNHDSAGDHLYLMEKGDRWACNHTAYHSNKQYYFEEIEGGGSSEPATLSLPGLAEPEPMVETNNGSLPTLEDLFGGGEATSVDPVWEPAITIEDLPCLSFRDIPKAHYEKYGCHMELSETDLSIQRVYYPMGMTDGTSMWKIRIVKPEKDFKTSETINGREYEFIGQRLYRGQKELLVNEGQDDAVAADFLLNPNMSTPITLQVLCVSLPSGDNLKAFKDNQSFLKKFDRITYCQDGDEAGAKVTEKLAQLRPDTVFMDITEKDACDMVKAKKSVEFVGAYGKASKYRPPSIEVLTEEDILTLSTPLELGLSYPWDEITKLTYGMTPHTIVSLGAGAGVGKSSIVRAVQQWLMFKHEKQVGIFSVEETKRETLRYLVGYMINERVHVPGITYDTVSAVATGRTLIDKALFFNSDGYDGLWSEIEEAIRYMYADGVRFFFIDPVSALVAHLDPSAANTYLNTMMIKLKALKNELPIWIMLVNHLNNPTSGKMHDEGGMVMPSQFFGSKGMWRFSTEMVGAERDLLNEDEDIRNTLTWRQLKHRTDGSKAGRTVKFLYNKETGRVEVKALFTPLITETPGFDPGEGGHDPIPPPKKLELPELFSMDEPITKEEEVPEVEEKEETFEVITELPPMTGETRTMMEILNDG